MWALFNDTSWRGKMSEDINIPKNNQYLDSKKDDSRKRMEKSILEFNKILNDKTAPENQTSGYENNVKTMLNGLLVSANDLDNINPGEGIFSLIILCIRSILKLRDKNTELEIQVKKLSNEITKLKMAPPQKK